MLLPLLGVHHDVGRGPAEEARVHVQPVAHQLVGCPLNGLGLLRGQGDFELRGLSSDTLHGLAVIGRGLGIGCRIAAGSAIPVAAGDGGRVQQRQGGGHAEPGDGGR